MIFSYSFVNCLLLKQLFVLIVASLKLESKMKNYLTLFQVMENMY